MDGYKAVGASVDRGVAAMKYRPDIDGLRALAVIPVVLYHLDLGWMRGGYVGVDIFFVISGYLITGIISAEIEQGSFTIAGFYERRVRRIFPALFAMLAIVLVAGWMFLLPSDYVIALRGALATVLFSSNVLFWIEIGYFAPSADLNPLLHTWSLAVEEQFYVLFPIFLVVCYRYFPRRVRALTGIVGAISLILAIVFVRSAPNAAFFLSPCRAWELIVGCLLALGLAKPLTQRWQRELIGGLGLASIVYALFAYSDATPFPGYAALPPVLGAAALIHAGKSGDSFATRFLKLPVLVYVGAISYSLYLWHWPIIVFARFGTELEPFGWHASWLFIAILLVAMASYHLVEKPFRNRRIGNARSSLFYGAAAATTILILLSGVGLWAHGMPDRFDARTLRLDAQRNAPIPFGDCDGRSQLVHQPYCVIGNKTAGPPTLLIWGDSHALAWAPAFDMALKPLGVAAILAISSGCPPMLGIHNAIYPACHAQNLEVRQLVDEDRDLKGAILIGYWKGYFADSIYILSNDRGVIGNRQVAPDALMTTLRHLQDRDLMTVVMGDVPGARKDVPLMMALESMHGSAAMPPRNLAEVRANNAALENAMHADAVTGHATYIDVDAWFCDQRVCEYQQAGVPLYRDNSHLSVDGALTRIPQLTAMLENTGLGKLQTPSAPISSQTPIGNP